jgi:hypothetical protein
VAPGALQRKRAAEWLDVSEETFDRHVRPHLKCVYVGSLRLWPVTELQRWLDTQVR